MQWHPSVDCHTAAVCSVQRCPTAHYHTAWVQWAVCVCMCACAVYVRSGHGRSHSSLCASQGLGHNHVDQCGQCAELPLRGPKPTSDGASGQCQALGLHSWRLSLVLALGSMTVAIEDCPSLFAIRHSSAVDLRVRPPNLLDVQPTRQKAPRHLRRSITTKRSLPYRAVSPESLPAQPHGAEALGVSVGLRVADSLQRASKDMLLLVGACCVLLRYASSAAVRPGLWGGSGQPRFVATMATSGSKKHNKNKKQPKKGRKSRRTAAGKDFATEGGSGQGFGTASGQERKVHRGLGKADEDVYEGYIAVAAVNALFEIMLSESTELQELLEELGYDPRNQLPDFATEILTSERWLASELTEAQQVQAGTLLSIQYETARLLPWRNVVTYFTMSGKELMFDFRAPEVAWRLRVPTKDKVAWFYGSDTGRHVCDVYDAKPARYSTQVRQTFTNAPPSPQPMIMGKTHVAVAFVDLSVLAYQPISDDQGTLISGTSLGLDPMVLADGNRLSFLGVDASAYQVCVADYPKTNSMAAAQSSTGGSNIAASTCKRQILAANGLGVRLSPFLVGRLRRFTAVEDAGAVFSCPNIGIFWEHSSRPWLPCARSASPLISSNGLPLATDSPPLLRGTANIHTRTYSHARSRILALELSQRDISQ